MSPLPLFREESTQTILGEASLNRTVVKQVCSITQFHSAGFSQSRKGVKKCVFTTTRSRFGSAFFTVSWSFTQVAANLTPANLVSFYISAAPKQRARQVEDPRQKHEVAGINRREKCFPDEWLLICPQGKSKIFFTKKEAENLSGQTCFGVCPKTHSKHLVIITVFYFSRTFLTHVVPDTYISIFSSSKILT